MLSQLIISDFAIIEHLEIDFKKGLNILSGETGAGKSIIINAVNLILGGRASSDLIRTGAGEARVEALFSGINNSALKAFMTGADIPFENELIIKRTISKEGRNRIMVNGSLTTLQILSSVGSMIISISGQHEHQSLLKPDNHLYILDEFGELAGERKQFSEEFHLFDSLKERIKRLEKEISGDREKQELTLFQIKEIDESGLHEGEDIHLEEEKNRLRHADQIKEITAGSYSSIYERENSIISELSLCMKDIERCIKLDARLQPVKNVLESARAELEDASWQLREIRDDIEADPGRLEAVDDRIHRINNLKRKYGSTIGEILETREKLSGGIKSLDLKEKELEETEKKLKKQINAVSNLAGELSLKRIRAAESMNRAVESELNQLGMSGTGFEARFADTKTTEIDTENALPEGTGPDGFDRVEFMISPNKGEELRPLARIASGGELSRIMLSLKTILAKKGSVETVIFDEVDAGIGGATAETVGEKLNVLAGFHQIICITHLPQIASKGQNHYLVKKSVQNERTRTEIKELEKEQRVQEIARLLGGKTITEQAVLHAREMLGW